MLQIINQLNAEGYPVRSIVPDGKIQRFRLDDKDHKNSGFYVAYRNFHESTGQEFYVIVYGSWRENETKTICTLQGGITHADRKAIQSKVDEAKRKEEQLRNQKQSEVSDEVSQIWQKLSLQGSSSYLVKKQIADCPNMGIRYGQEGEIYVPARDHNGRIWSFQRIGADGFKLFHSGGRVRGCFHIIGTPAQSDILYVTEGFATACSIHLATGKPTVCAFNAGNLTEVGIELKKHFTDKQLIICGDDDKWGEKNPGREKAELAAKSCLGKAVFPVFKEGKFTDFNDLHCAEGIEEVTNQLVEESLIENPQYFRALGFKEKEYFFTSSSNQQIVSISAFSKTDFLNLMPLEYWETMFPGRGAQKVAWDDAQSQLTVQCREIGIFESQNVRGAGVWEDQGRIVVNMGDHLIVDGKMFSLGGIKSRYFYTLGIKLPGLHPNPLTAKECEVILLACELFKWKKRDFGYLLAGAMVTTRVCGALPIRPHLWLTGEKGSGKTTLFNRLIYPLIGEPLIFAGGNTTEAGLRQEVCANAIPVLFDEFENQGGRSTEIIQSVLDLMRLSWSETRASVIKGGSGGVATSYRARFAAIVTSIRQISLSDADRSRFATVELGPHDSDPVHWKELDGLLRQIDIEFGNRLFARIIRMVPVILGNFKLLKKAFSKNAASQRFADQYGMLLAGYATLMQDEMIDESQADCMVGWVKLEDEKAEVAITDQDMALDHLLTTKIRFETNEMLIGEMVKLTHENSTLNYTQKNALSRLGIRVESDSVFIASRHSELQKQVFYGTNWTKSWNNSLSRLLGAQSNQQAWVSEKNFKGIRIPMHYFFVPSHS